MRASASGNCSCSALIRLAARWFGTYQATMATSTIATIAPMTLPTRTPTDHRQHRARSAALMTRYSPARSGMAARSRRCSSAPLRVDAPEDSGDADGQRRELARVRATRSRPRRAPGPCPWCRRGSAASVRCCVRTRMIAATTAIARPAPTSTAATKASVCELSCSAPNMACLTSRPGDAPASRRSLRTVARHTAGPGRAEWWRPAGRDGQERRVHLVAEDVRRNLDAVERQFVEDLRPQAGRDQAARPFGHVHPVEDVLEQNGVALHALDLGDRMDHAWPGRGALQLDEEADGHDDLLADGPLWQLHAAHHHHGLQPAQQLAGRVGVHRGHGPGVAGVHGLEHVERLGATTLTDDDAVGPHTEGVADEVTDADSRRCPPRWPAGSPGSRRGRPGSGVRPIPRS